MEETRAAIFDFDGIIFHPDTKWKVSDVRLGSTGSRISFEKALSSFKSLSRDNPDLLLTDCFTLDEFEYDHRDAHEMNLTPPLLVAKNAQNHVFKGHDLYFLSICKHRELSDITKKFIGELRYPILKNPFEVAKHLYPEQDYYEGIHKEKFELFLALMQKKDQKASRSASKEKIYTRIYYYYSEEHFANQLRSFLKENFEKFEGGRNSITFSYIANTK